MQWNSTMIMHITSLIKCCYCILENTAFASQNVIVVEKRNDATPMLYTDVTLRLSLVVFNFYVDWLYEFMVI